MTQQLTAYTDPTQKNTGRPQKYDGPGLIDMWFQFPVMHRHRQILHSWV